MPKIKLGRKDTELFRIMHEKGITQKEVADRMGVTQSAVSKKLSGERVMTMQEFRVVAIALQLEDSEILEVIKGKC